MAKCLNCGKEGLLFPENWVKGKKLILIDPQSDRAHICDILDIMRHRPAPKVGIIKKCECGTEYGPDSWCPNCFIEVQYLVKAVIEKHVNDIGETISRTVELPEEKWYWETTIRYYEDAKWRIASGQFRLPPYHPLSSDQL